MGCWLAKKKSKPTLVATQEKCLPRMIWQLEIRDGPKFIEFI